MVNYFYLIIFLSWRVEGEIYYKGTKGEENEKG